jgi:DNA-binding beta-propeller fold protein YncE
MSLLTIRWGRRLAVTLLLAATALLLTPTAATADVVLPPGFSVHVYVTGEGFNTGGAQLIRGIPATSTLAFDHQGALYLARPGRRYSGGETEGLTTIYRIPLGGARLSPGTEALYAYGPPLWNPQVSGSRGGREIFVTTFDRDRKLGVVYRLRNERAEFLAGSGSIRDPAPLLRQPEGAAIDAAGNVYVADRELGIVVRLDPSGRVLDPRYVAVTRPRVLAVDDANQLWIAGDGTAEAPWQRGQGEIWKVSSPGVPSLVVRGPVSAGISLSPGGHLFVADRHNGQIGFLTADGALSEFASFTDGDAPRSLGFAPVTPETRRAGIAGDLFVVVINRAAWPVNEVIRISGAFDEFVRARDSGRR